MPGASPGMTSRGRRAVGSTWEGGRERASSFQREGDARRPNGAHAEEAAKPPSRSMRPPPSFETGATRPPQGEGGSAGATGGTTDVRNEIYRESGVDTAEADAGL